MNKATRAFVSTFGAIMALAGIEHGIGEVLQGSVAPSGIMILSWPDSAFFRNVGGEPAMTVIPSMLVTGILAIVLSLAMLAWATLFVERKHGALVMILISIGMLLAGGGIFPPVLAILIGVVASRIHSPLIWWRTRLPPGARQLLAGLWPWSFGACIIAWGLMFTGPALVGYLFGAEKAELVWAFLLFALGTLVSTIVTGVARDAQARTVDGVRGHSGYGESGQIEGIDIIAAPRRARASSCIASWPLEPHSDVRTGLPLRRSCGRITISRL